MNGENGSTTDRFVEKLGDMYELVKTKLSYLAIYRNKHE